MSNNIAVLGVDGTGKSTVLSSLKEKLGDKCVLQYMGYRSFNNKRIGELQKKANKNVYENVTLIISIYLDFRGRVKKAKKTKKIVIYDRYVHEIYINSLGKSRFLYKLLYKYLFPQPKALVYLYCNADTSFARKDDIIDKQAFIDMKKRFDSSFMNKKNVLSLSSDEYTPEQLADKIIAYLNNSH